ncbi:hypothetical protein DSECCO2_652950 [anaerobic digester metagenome]
MQRPRRPDQPLDIGRDRLVRTCSGVTDPVLEVGRGRDRPDNPVLQEVAGVLHENGVEICGELRGRPLADAFKPRKIGRCLGRIEVPEPEQVRLEGIDVASPPSGRGAPRSKHHGRVKPDAADVVDDLAPLRAPPSPHSDIGDVDVVAASPGEGDPDMVPRKAELVGQHLDQFSGLFLDPRKHHRVRAADDLVGVEVEDQVGTGPVLIVHRRRRRRLVVGRRVVDVGGNQILDVGGKFLAVHKSHVPPHPDLGRGVKEDEPPFALLKRGRNGEVLPLVILGKPLFHKLERRGPHGNVLIMYGPTCSYPCFL